MSFEKALQTTSRLVALAGLLALLLTREAADWLVLPATAIALLGISSARLAGPALSGWPVTALTLLSMAFAVLDFFILSGSLILAGAHFLVILLCIKLLSLAGPRDYFQLYILSFFILLASTGLSTEYYFLAAFFLFFVSLTWAMMLITIKDQAGGSQAALIKWKPGKVFFGGTALLTLASVMFTAVIFLAIPRVGIGYFSRQGGGLIRVSGFSDRVALGSFGQVLLDPTAVMRVQFPDGRPGVPLYWRGRAFDRYDGRVWEDTIGGRRFAGRMPGGNFFLNPTAPRLTGQVVQNIALEPLQTTALFALYPTTQITGGFGTLVTDISDALYMPYQSEGRTFYTAISAPGSPTDAQLLLAGDVRPQYHEKYLQLPEGSEEIKALAARIAGGGRNTLEKVRSVEDYLRENYRYTLSPRRGNNGEPVNNFLFDTKEGYCEHFATAAALLLRATGVPSRLVSGFSGGEWNRYGNFMLVREKDAHTWIEVYFGRHGWVMFDPTPEAPRPGPGFLAGAAGILDSLKFKWDRHVVFYSLRDQAGGAKKLFGAYSRLKDRLSSFGGGEGEGHGARIFPRSAKWTFLAFVSAAFVAILLISLRRYSKKRKGGGTGIGFYDEMVEALKATGIMRPPCVTPLEFARTVAGESDALAGAFYITEIYNRTRFGADNPSPVERARLEAELRLLKKTLKGRGRERPL